VLYVLDNTIAKSRRIHTSMISSMIGLTQVHDALSSAAATCEVLCFSAEHTVLSLSEDQKFSEPISIQGLTIEDALDLRSTLSSLIETCSALGCIQ
jgi:hypothetical protein